LKVAFIYNSLTYFTQLDLRILQKYFDVDVISFKKKYEILKFYSYYYVLKNSDIVICWFSSWHTFFPLIFSKILGKKFILITGGYDTANLPHARYGNQRFFFVRFLTNFCIRNADILIVNSNFIKNEVLSIGNIQAYKIHVIYHGIPENANNYLSPKEQVALNVGNFSNENLLRKGILPFLDASKYLDTWKFIQVGSWQDDSFYNLQNTFNTNVDIKGFVSQENLIDLFKSASVYIQPSLHEGFGISVIEAMQHGCIPIVSKFGALPEVVKDYGIILNDLSPDTIASAITEAINKFDHLRSEIRDFVNLNYSLNLREIKILQLIKTIL
jgi:glycosyltransferase involved in cell wall biosynthesis